MDTHEDILDFVKALASPERLKVVGMLAERPASLDALSATLGISPTDLTEHLDQLTAAGVVSQDAGQFKLDEAAVEKFRREKLHRPREVFTPPDHLNAEESKIIQKLAAPDGSLKRLPIQLKQLKAVLNYILPVFSPGVDYTEKQVNALLIRFHPDSAALRRYLVEDGLIRRERDGSRYWREVRHD